MTLGVVSIQVSLRVVEPSESVSLGVTSIDGDDISTVKSRKEAAERVAEEVHNLNV